MPNQAKEIFEAQSKSLLELLSDNGLGFYLPPYQRPYGWDKGKVEKLLDDTLHGLKNLAERPGSFTFLGTVITVHDVEHVTVEPKVKQDVPSKVLTVIDGQQRLSSLLLLLVCLHNLIRQHSWKIFNGKEPDRSDVARNAFYGEILTVLDHLGKAFCEKKNFGEAPIYPRLIRAYVDQWSTAAKYKQYESPIAHLLYTYAVQAAEEPFTSKPTDFKPKARSGAGDGEGDLVKRFTEIRASITKLSQRKSIEALEDLPPLSQLAECTKFQYALFSHELPEDLRPWLREVEEQEQPEAVLMRLVMFAAYVLNRIAITVVQGKDEDYAFTIFESLNTTGEPLTAFETFLPRVVKEEGITDYKGSEAQGHMDSVQNYLNRFGVGEKLQSATQELLVTFALAETGTKLSKRLPDQRVYMKDTFDRHKDIPDCRDAYLLHLSNTATFIGTAWSPAEGATRQLSGLPPAAMTDTVKLCLLFLTALNHSIAIAPLVRFYSEAINADDSTEQDRRIRDFETAIKAITAFTVFWRATRRGTGNIDSQYRSVLAGENLTGMGPLGRQWSDSNRTDPKPVVDGALLKKELAARLSSTDKKYGEIPNLASFLSVASALPFYEISKPLTRFLLLAAYHDSIEDLDRPGSIKAGKPGAAPCFSSDGWLDETHLTIEHIAPQQPTSGWDQSFYSEREIVHQLGNLVLAPIAANASLSSRPWSEKKVLYDALGCNSADGAKAILDKSGLTFAQSTEDLAKMSHYLPHLKALGLIKEEGNSDLMAERAKVLLRLVYDRLKDWLDLDWSEENTGEHVNPIKEDPGPDQDGVYPDEQPSERI